MTNHDTLSVLVAEDEESFRQVLVAVLETTNRFIVYQCETGDAAIEALKRAEFDIVILDYMMPGLTGLNVLQWMHEQKSDTPAILLTGAGSEEIAVEAMKLGAYDYLRKEHFDRDHFLIVVNSVYERYLFKKEKEMRENALRELDNAVSAIQSLKNSMSSFAFIAQSTAKKLASLTNETERLLAPIIAEEEKAQFEAYFKDTRSEHETLMEMANSLSELARLLTGSPTPRKRAQQTQEDPTLLATDDDQKVPINS
jgi:DNA-binding response OmpR family regulator